MKKSISRIAKAIVMKKLEPTGHNYRPNKDPQIQGAIMMWRNFTAKSKCLDLCSQLAETDMPATIKNLKKAYDLWQSENRSPKLPRHPKFLEEWKAIPGILLKSMEFVKENGPEEANSYGSPVTGLHYVCVNIGDGPGVGTHFY